MNVLADLVIIFAVAYLCMDTSKYSIIHFTFSLDSQCIDQSQTYDEMRVPLASQFLEQQLLDQINMQYQLQELDYKCCMTLYNVI